MATKTKPAPKPKAKPKTTIAPRKAPAPAKAARAAKKPAKAGARKAISAAAAPTGRKTLGQTWAANAHKALAAPSLATLDQLHPSALNPRAAFDDATIRELAASIAENGLMQNLVVRARAKGGGYEIVAGERRYRALKLLQKEGKAPDRIPVRVLAGDDVAVRALALVENLQREDLNPMDEARAFKALRELGWDNAAIAGKIAKTPRHVQLRLKLVEALTPETQAALETGKISLAHARALTLAPAKEQGRYLKEIVGDSWRTPSAELLQDRLTRALPEMANAIFDRALYEGETIERANYGGRPTLVAVDKAQWWKLQDAAIKARKDKLAQAWAWVDLRRGYPTFGGSPDSKDKTKAGAVIFVAPDGGVTVRTGVLKGKTPARESLADRDARWKAEKKKREEAKARNASIAALLPDRVVAQPALGLAIHLHEKMDSYIYDSATAKRLIKAHFPGALRDALHRRKSDAIWHTLRGLSVEQLVKIADVLGALQVDDLDYDGELSDLQKSLVEHFKIETAAPAPTTPAKPAKAARKTKAQRATEEKAAASIVPAPALMCPATGYECDHDGGCLSADRCRTQADAKAAAPDEAAAQPAPADQPATEAAIAGVTMAAPDAGGDADPFYIEPHLRRT